MKTASISEAKATLSALLDRVKAGEEVTITDRGKPVARIVPIPPADVDWDERLERLAREGRVILPRKALDLQRFLSRPLVTPRESVLEALLEERRESDR